MELQREIYTIESTKRPVNEYADTHWSILHKNAPMSNTLRSKVHKKKLSASDLIPSCIM